VALEPVIRDALAAAEPTKRGARITHTAEVAALHLRADPSALHQLLLNVLLNAAQAVDSGGSVRVTARANDGAVIVEIHDDGRGIPPDQLSRVFDPFYTTRAGGTGLGLAVARRIAIAHGGQLTLDSVEGQGTTATIRLRGA
jgi:signal transduction histidine kinase